jgi:hypothetical protein
VQCKIANSPGVKLTADRPLRGYHELSSLNFRVLILCQQWTDRTLGNTVEPEERMKGAFWGCYTFAAGDDVGGESLGPSSTAALAVCTKLAQRTIGGMRHAAQAAPVSLWCGRRLQSFCWDQAGNVRGHGSSDPPAAH